jgi:inhibitor of cysteine peptidase
MKSKIILTCAVVALALSLFACSSEVAVSASYDGKEVKVPVDGSLIVTLESNPTTGFKWQYEEEVKDTLHILTGIPDETVLALVGQKFVAPEAGAPPGTGGEEVWTFRAMGKGTTELSMEYSQPWEGGMKAARTFNLTIVVK